jgi:hypothetical protein
LVDLICADENGVPFHATSDCVLDCAWGSGENDFELTLYDGTVLPTVVLSILMGPRLAASSII